MAGSDFDLSAIAQADINDLYADLAVAATGTEPHLGLALENVATLRRNLAEADFNPIDWLIEKGKALFNKYWPAVRDAVCKFWKDSGEDWIKEAADAISKALGLPGAVVALILKIAVKLGFDAVCGTNAAAAPAA